MAKAERVQVFSIDIEDVPGELKRNVRSTKVSDIEFKYAELGYSLILSNGESVTHEDSLSFTSQEVKDLLFELEAKHRRMEYLGMSCSLSLSVEQEFAVSVLYALADRGIELPRWRAEIRWHYQGEDPLLDKNARLSIDIQESTEESIISQGKFVLLKDEDKY